MKEQQTTYLNVFVFLQQYKISHNKHFIIDISRAPFQSKLFFYRQKFSLTNEFKCIVL